MQYTICTQINTQAGKILSHLMDNPNEWYLPHEFMGSRQDVPYVGYKASTRLSELQQKGLIKSRWSEEMRKRKIQMKEYSISEYGLSRVHIFKSSVEITLDGERKKVVAKKKNTLITHGLRVLSTEEIDEMLAEFEKPVETKPKGIFSWLSK